MGGINHQPCNGVNARYLACSTTMSRCVSQAHAGLEEANISLEDLLLEELCGREGSIEIFLDHLDVAQDQLVAVSESIESLRQELVRSNYKDLPTLHALDLSSRGLALSEQGLVEENVWNQVVSIMKRGSFYMILDEFDKSVSQLRLLTQDLRLKASRNTEASRNGELNLVLEQNLPGNFKVEFAVLYTAWSRFHSFFLTSSMLSTELWYAYTHNGSLLTISEGVQVA